MGGTQKKQKRQQFAMWQAADSGWATFLRVAYVVYVLAVSWAGFTAMYGSGVFSIKAPIVPVEPDGLLSAMIMLALILAIQFNSLPKTTKGMLALFAPLLFIVVDIIAGDFDFFAVQLAIVHVGAAVLAFPLYVYLRYIKTDVYPGVVKGVYGGVFAALTVYMALGVALLVEYYLRGMVDYVNSPAVRSDRLWIGTILLFVFTAEQLRVYLKALHADKKKSQS